MTFPDFKSTSPLHPVPLAFPSSCGEQPSIDTRGQQPRPSFSAFAALFFVVKNTAIGLSRSGREDGVPEGYGSESVRNRNPMRRFNQQTWFCIAAVWLAGSLSMYWADEIRVPAQELATKETSRLPQVIRRHQDLKANTLPAPIDTGTKASQAPQSSVIHTPTSPESPPQRLEIPEIRPAPRSTTRLPAQEQSANTVKANGFLLLPDTAQDQEVTQTVEQTSFENQTKLPNQPVLWLEGRIELPE